MSRIALLDTSVCPEGLHCKSFQFHRICGNTAASRSSVLSHGTICARVLDQFAGDYDLVNIQILPDVEKEAERPAGHIRDLKEGLSFCLRLNVDVVCLSSVSSVLSDSGYLFSVTQELSQKSILVSALDNRRYVTVPTSYPFVTGVQADRLNHLSPGELAWQEGDPFSAQVYANCNLDLLRQLRSAPSNSFAVPVAAAKINNWINQKKNAEECLKELKPYPRLDRTENPGDRNPFAGQDLPVVAVYGFDDRDTYAACKEAMDQLYDQHQVQTSALCSLEHPYDIRFRMAGNGDKILEDLSFMEGHYKTDLIFLAISEREKERMLSQVEPDVEIAVDHTSVRIRFEEKELEANAADIADLLVQIL